VRYRVIVPAAGVGRRFGDRIPKQYSQIHGRTVLEWCLAPFLADPSCSAVIVAIAAADPHWPAVAARLAPVRTAAGGQERVHSVRNALATLQGEAASDDWILVHDAARPCLPAEDLRKLLETLQDHEVGGLLAAPAADTLKACGPGNVITHTVDRSGLWRALTPQMFRYGRLCEALDAACARGKVPTDESQALEWLGDRPQVVEGSAVNLKITSAQDLLVASALLAARRGESTLQEEHAL